MDLGSRIKRGVTTRAVKKVMGSARVSRAGERVLAIANFSCAFEPGLRFVVQEKACFGATPLQRIRSNGHAFQPARVTRALPNPAFAHAAIPAHYFRR